MASPIPRKLWEHPDPKRTQMYKFMQEANRKHNLNIKVRPRHGRLVMRCGVVCS
jgi:hypothetical protein